MSNKQPALRQRIVTTAVISALVPGVASAAAGRIQFAIGDVKGIDRDGNERRLRRGALLEQGDTVRTARGRAQIRFSDGAFTSLQPETEFRIDGYEYDEKKTENSRGFFSLLKGGLRTITGAIGKLRERSYRLTTPVATIGIRGTEYTAVLGNSLDVNVGLGTITASNGAGTLIISNGESAHIAGPGSYPLLTPDKPVLPPPVVGQRSDDGDTESTDYQFGTDFNAISKVLSPVVKEALQDGARYAVAVAYGDDVEGSNLYARGVSPDQLAFGAFNPQEELIGFAANPPNGNEIAAINTASVATGSGAVPFSGVDGGAIGWGRWTNGVVQASGDEYSCCGDVVSMNLNANEGHHYVIGPPTEDMPNGSAGTVLFNLVGATQPTNTMDAGVMNSGTLTAYFGDHLVDVDMNFTLGGNTFVTDANGLGINGHTFAGSNNGWTSIGSGSSSVNTTIQGFFAGTGASHAGLGYKVEYFDGYRAVGTAAFKSTGGPPPAMP